MKLRDYYLTPENLPRIKRLGYVRFVLLYGVVPLTVLMTTWIPLNKWFTTRGTVFSDVVDVLELARNTAMIAPLVGLVLGTLMWFAMIGAGSVQTELALPPKPRKRTSAIGLVLIGIVLGGSIGVSIGVWIHREMMSPWEDSQVAYGAAWYHRVFASELYLNGDYPTARAALLEHVRVLQGIEDMQLEYTSFLNPRIEIAYTYARLSLLEEANGNNSESALYWEEATTLLESIGWKSVQRDRVLRYLEVSDGSLPDGIEAPDRTQGP